MKTGIETLAVTTLVNSSSVPLAVIMLLLALRGGVFLVIFGHSRVKCPTFSQIKHLGLKPLLVPVFDSIGNLHWCAKLKQQCKNLADSHEIAEKEVWRSVQ
ncbi:hypothetical protein TNCV_1936221 [Trichonephila clavipes]|nr:hypothetical protein TNCV_1936221 [Trichonephila clavipes]